MPVNIKSSALTLLHWTLPSKRGLRWVKRFSFLIQWVCYLGQLLNSFLTTKTLDVTTKAKAISELFRNPEKRPQVSSGAAAKSQSLEMSKPLFVSNSWLLWSATKTLSRARVVRFPFFGVKWLLVQSDGLWYTWACELVLLGLCYFKKQKTSAIE